MNTVSRPVDRPVEEAAEEAAEDPGIMQQHDIMIQKLDLVNLAHSVRPFALDNVHSVAGHNRPPWDYAQAVI